MSESSLLDFKRRVHEAHPREFDLHYRVAAIVEREIVAQPRSHPDAVSLVLDMLIVQAHKSHLSARVLGEHGHIEDMATIVRRLLELAMQSTYIGGDSEDTVRQQRAAQFIAFLWDSIPDKQKAKLPAELRSYWEGLASSAPDRRPDRTRWGPRFNQMFEYAEHRDTYDRDYRLLSALAHGSSGSLLIQYSKSPIPVHSIKQVGTLLIYASRYYLAVLDHWIRLYSPAIYDRLAGVFNELDHWTLADEPAQEEE